MIDVGEDELEVGVLGGDIAFAPLNELWDNIDPIIRAVF